MDPITQSKLIGYASAPVAVWSVWASGSKSMWTWYTSFVLYAAFGYVNWILGLYGFLVMDVVAFVLSIRGWWRWRQEEDRKAVRDLALIVRAKLQAEQDLITATRKDDDGQGGTS